MAEITSEMLDELDHWTNGLVSGTWPRTEDLHALIALARRGLEADELWESLNATDALERARTAEAQAQRYREALIEIEAGTRLPGQDKGWIGHVQRVARAALEES